MLKFRDIGTGAIVNNNFTSSTLGIGTYNQGTEVLASTSAWESAMSGVVSDRNILHYLFYDGSSTNPPAGPDFDVLWSSGLTSNDYLVVSERDGNTNFAVTPLGVDGAPISGARTLRFGFTTGTTSANGNNKYDWNTRYASTGRSEDQPQYMTVVSVGLFNTSSAVYGLRIDNNGNADVKFYGFSDSTFNDNPPNPLIPGIQGNVFGDTNGLADNTVNGLLLNTASSSDLYVSLVQGGSVIATVPVNADGSYNFLNITPGTYTTVLHLTAGGSTSSSLPNNWVSTGENDGAGSGNDGNVNGVNASIVVTDSLETQVNFGIEQLPDSDGAQYGIGAAPTTNSIRDLVNSDNMGSLSGEDPEDGVYGSGGDFVITDTTGLNGNILFYDANGDGAYTAGEELDPDDTVRNYNPSRLSVVFVRPIATSFRFKYAWIDAAGMVDPSPAPYIVNWASPIPVTLIGFEAESLDQNYAELKWSTATEINNDRFEIQRKLDSESEFSAVGIVGGAGNSNSLNSYSYIDNVKSVKEKVCYRLKQVDYDGTYEFSPVDCIDNSFRNVVSIYPNPASTFITVEVSNLEANVLVEVLSIDGRVLLQRDQISASEKIDINMLSNGTYFIRLTQDNQIENFRIQVVK
jgi:hypothetical protein